MNLLYEFSKEFKIKENFRNIFYDLLINSTAFRMKYDLQTRDSLLTRFSARMLEAPIVKSRVLGERRSPISVGGGTTGGTGRWGCGANGAGVRSTSRTAS
jgi:hypothetical protein